MTPLQDAGNLDRPERLLALERSGLLRHDVVGRLDLLCETACTILEVPMSQVNILGSDYQVNIGKWPPDDDRVMDVRLTICKEVIAALEPVVVPDTLLHPVMCLSPIVTVSGARSYLGVPIFFSGEAIGTFCVGDLVVRNWHTWNVAGLQGLARLAGLAVNGDD